MASATLSQATGEVLTDEQVVQRVLAGETAMYEILMRRYNQRIYRAVRAILREDSEAEDVMQDAYVRAYRHLDQFRGEAQFSTWLTRIAVHEALARIRRRGRVQSLDEVFTDGGANVIPTHIPDPERQTSNGELGRLLEESILALPEHLRAVLMLRDVEEMSTADTAEALSISEENVKTRLHRGRAMVRRNLYARAGVEANRAFPFMGVRCDRVVQFVMAEITAF